MTYRKVKKGVYDVFGHKPGTIVGTVRKVCDWWESSPSTGWSRTRHEAAFKLRHPEARNA